MKRKNITIRLDPETARKYKIWLAKKGLSQQKHLENFIKREVSK
jgi:predicted DNA binding CopG/RHH family protein